MDRSDDGAWAMRRNKLSPNPNSFDHSAVHGVFVSAGGGRLINGDELTKILFRRREELMILIPIYIEDAAISYSFESDHRGQYSDKVRGRKYSDGRLVDFECHSGRRKEIQKCPLRRERVGNGHARLTLSCEKNRRSRKRRRDRSRGERTSVLVCRQIFHRRRLCLAYGEGKRMLA